MHVRIWQDREVQPGMNHQRTGTAPSRHLKKKTLTTDISC